MKTLVSIFGWILMGLRPRSSAL